MATTIPQENTAAIAANTAAISDLAAALAAEIENRRQIVDRAGAAAVEAVGATLRSGFTPWEFSGYSEGVAISEIVYDGGNWWRLELDYGGSHYSPDVEGGPDATELYFRGQYKEPEDTIRAVRHLITPTKTSQLTNDGDGTNAFVKTNDSRLSDARTPTAHSHAMSDVAGLGEALAGKLDDAAAYPAWEASPSPAYVAGTVVSYSGRLYRLDNPGLYGPDSPPNEDVEAWTEVLLRDLKQDALSQSQMSAVEKAGKAVLTLSVASQPGLMNAEQAVVVGGRTFSQLTWANRPPVVLAGVERAEIRYGDYAGDCFVHLNGVDVGRPESVVLEADSLLEVYFADCLHPDTPILMADGTRKRVADVRAGDRVATPFGSDEVTRTSAGRGARMDEWRFSDGTTVRTVGRHRFWNADLGEFMYLEAWNVGERAMRADGTVAELVSRRTSKGDFPHATLFTARWNVYYAGGLVAGNRKSARPWR